MSRKRTATNPKTFRKPKLSRADQQYAAGVVRVGESVSQFGGSPRDVASVLRGLQLSVWRACALNAKVCAAQPLRLYREAKGRKSGKRISKMRAAFLRGERGVKPGAKALQYAQASDNIEEVTEHAVLDMLRKPDPYMTGADFWRMTYFYMESTGMSPLWMGEEQGGQPVSLYILHPQYTAVVPSKNQMVEKFRFGRDPSACKDYPAEEVLYLRFMSDPQRPYAATTWAHSIQAFSDMEHAATTAEVNRWKHSGFPGVVVSVGKEWTDEQCKGFQESLRGTGGIQTAGRALVLRDSQLLQAAAKPHEMNYDQGLTRAELAIAGAADIPEAVWKLNSANLASAEVAETMYAKYGIYPRLCTVAECLTEFLLPVYGEEGMWFCHDNPVQEDETEYIAQLDRGYSNGYIRKNEVRLAIGLEALDDAEDGFKEAVGAMPVDPDTEDAEAPEDKPTEGIEGAPTEDIQATAMNGAQVSSLLEIATLVADGKLPLESARAVAVAAFPLVPPETIDAIFGPLANFTPTKEETNEQPPADDQEDGEEKAEPEKVPGDSDSQDPGGVPTSKSVVHSVGRWVFDRANECVCGITHKKAPDPTPIQRAIEDAVKQWLESAIKRGAASLNADGSVEIFGDANIDALLNSSIQAAFKAGAVDRLGESPSADALSSADAQQYVQEYTADLVKDITETVRAQIKFAVDDGLANGQSLNEIQQGIIDKAPEISQSRAEVIARTETSRAYQHGSVQQAKELGFNGKEWSLSGNPCPLCQGAALAITEPIPISNPFFPAGSSIAGTDGKTYLITRPVFVASEIHPNCSCSTIETLDAGENEGGEDGQ